MLRNVLVFLVLRLIYEKFHSFSFYYYYYYYSSVGAARDIDSLLKRNHR